MTNISSMAALATILMLAPVAHAVDRGVVGLPTAERDFHVAVRVPVASGCSITGIRFYSNDATVYPCISLRADVPHASLPRPGVVVREVRPFGAASGYVDVTFETYRVDTDTHVWAMITFPDLTPIRRRGVGGGPGIGWCESPSPNSTRSLFIVDGAVNEFLPGFDIALRQTEAAVQSMIVGNDQTAESLIDRLHVEARLGVDHARGAAVFTIGVPRDVAVSVDIFAVDGRRVDRIDRNLTAGWHRVVWPDNRWSGRSPASGVYLYRVTAQGEMQSGKVILVR